MYIKVFDFTGEREGSTLLGALAAHVSNFNLKQLYAAHLWPSVLTYLSMEIGFSFCIVVARGPFAATLIVAAIGATEEAGTKAVIALVYITWLALFFLVNPILR
jgi:hypothetical protein